MLLQMLQGHLLNIYILYSEERQQCLGLTASLKDIRSHSMQIFGIRLVQSQIHGLYSHKADMRKGH